MKIEAQRYYKNRAGRKVFVIGLMPSQKEWAFECEECCYTCELDGLYLGGCGKDSFDLISEWQESQPVVTKRELPDKFCRVDLKGYLPEYYDYLARDRITTLIEYSEGLEQRIGELESHGYSLSDKIKHLIFSVQDNADKFGLDVGDSILDFVTDYMDKEAKK